MQLVILVMALLKGYNEYMKLQYHVIEKEKSLKGIAKAKRIATKVLFQLLINK